MSYSTRVGLNLTADTNDIVSEYDLNQVILQKIAIARTIYRMYGSAEGLIAGGAMVFADLPSGTQYPAFTLLMADDAGEIWFFDVTANATIDFSAYTTGTGYLYAVIDTDSVNYASDYPAKAARTNVLLQVRDSGDVPNQSLLLGTGAVTASAFTTFTGTPGLRINISAENATSTVYVSKVGSNSNNGLNSTNPVLTITYAVTLADALITAGATRVNIRVMDSGTYTETPTLSDGIILEARDATLVGTLTLDGDSDAILYAHYSAGNNDVCLVKTGASSRGYYEAFICDGRGLAGTDTGTDCVRNSSNGSILFTRVNVMFVAESGKGITENGAGTGHIHFWTPDLYLAGNSAVGISLTTANGTFIGYIDHILEIGTPTTTTGIVMSNAGATLKLTASEIVADTAWNISSGTAYIQCPKITGTQTGTPTALSVVASGVLTSGRVPYATTGGLVVDSADMTFNATNGLILGDGTASSLNLSDTAGDAASGILFGGDVTLYRSAENVLKTDDALIVTGNLTNTALTATRVPYASTGGLLVDSANMIFNATNGLSLGAGSASALNLSSTAGTAVGGILFGGNVNLYRSADNVLKTDDALNVVGDVYTSALTDYSGTSSVTGWDSFTTKDIRYKKVGKTVTVYFNISGTSNDTVAYFTVPFSAAFAIGGGSFAIIVDNSVSVTTPGRIQIGAGGTTIVMEKTYSGTAWTNTNTKTVKGQFTYEANA